MLNSDWLAKQGIQLLFSHGDSLKIDPRLLTTSDTKPCFHELTMIATALTTKHFFVVDVLLSTARIIAILVKDTTLNSVATQTLPTNDVTHYADFWNGVCSSPSVGNPRNELKSLSTSWSLSHNGCSWTDENSLHVFQSFGYCQTWNHTTHNYTVCDHNKGVDKMDCNWVCMVFELAFWGQFYDFSSFSM